MNNTQTDIRIVRRVLADDLAGADLDTLVGQQGLVRETDETDLQLRTRLFNFLNQKSL